VLLGDETQVPLDGAHAELSHPEVPQAREDLLIQAVAVGLLRRGAEVLEAGEPRLGERLHSRGRRDLPVDVELGTVAEGEPQRCLGSSLCLGVSLDLTTPPVVVAIPGDGAVAGGRGMRAELACGAERQTGPAHDLPLK
jgi:hypothetical protein